MGKDAYGKLAACRTCNTRGAIVVRVKGNRSGDRENVVSNNRKKRRKANRLSPRRRGRVVTLSLYGPNDAIATKMVGCLVKESTGKIEKMERGCSEGGKDVREVVETVQGLARISHQDTGIGR